LDFLQKVTKAPKILRDCLESFTEGDSKGLRAQAKAIGRTFIPTKPILPGQNQANDESEEDVFALNFVRDPGGNKTQPSFGSLSSV